MGHHIYIYNDRGYPKWGVLIRWDTGSNGLKHTHTHVYIFVYIYIYIYIYNDRGYPKWGYLLDGTPYIYIFKYPHTHIYVYICMLLVTSDYHTLLAPHHGTWIMGASVGMETRLFQRIARQLREFVR